MPCQIKNIQCDDITLQELFSRLENAISLAALVLAGWQFARRLTVLLIEETLDTRAQQQTDWSNCPTCGKKLQSKGFAKRQITTLMGVIRFSRRVGRCTNRCRIGQIAPLDTQLQLTAGQRSCLTLKRFACLLTIFVPFETAQALLNRLMGISVSPPAIWRWVQHAGQGAIDTLNDQLQSLAQGAPVAVESIDPADKKLPLLIGADGVMVPFRRQKGTPKGATRWREVKVAVIARLRKRLQKRESDPEKAETQLVHRRLVACLGKIDDLGQRLWLEALRQDVTTAKQVVWISDGARGFWRLFHTYFAEYAIGILDFYHAVENLWKAAKSWLDGRTTGARGWFVSARHRLRHGPTMGVRMDIETAYRDPKLPSTVRNVLGNLIDYLDTHHNHIQYHQFKSMELPIGSGMVESACKWLIIQRFKGVGMRWSEEGFNSLLHLRLAWVNQRFDELFPSSPN